MRRLATVITQIFWQAKSDLCTVDREAVNEIRDFLQEILTKNDNTSSDTLLLENSKHLPRRQY